MSASNKIFNTRVIQILVFLSFVIVSYSQEPVQWSNTAKKIDDKTYEVHLKGTLTQSWHLFSQIQPRGAIPMPTRLRFQKNPLISLVGRAKEIGNKVISSTRSLGTKDYRYSDSLEFVQVVRLKAAVKTNIAGSITYQVCTDERCMSPKTVKFSLSLE